MDKGQKPNETQESRVEEKRNITTVVNNSSNIGEERKTAAVVVRTSDSVNDRGNEIVSPRLDPVQSTSCFCSAHGLSLLVPRVKYGLPTACRNSSTVCGNSPAACGNFHPRLLLQGFFQSGNRLFRVFFFFEQSDELTAMIAPEACSQAAWNVALLEIPNPTINGLFRCIPSIFLK